MPTYNKFNAWAEHMVEGANLGSDQFAVALTNTLPTASNTVIADIAQISYTGLSSRNITTTSSSQTSGAFSLAFANLTLTASASVGPFRYVVIYDDTVASDPLVGWYDLGASMSLGASEGLVLQGMGLDMAGGFTPVSLFSGGEEGAWYDFSDLSTLFQDSAGSTPVTADGDLIGKVLDKSGNGNHLTQATSGRKPEYKTSGGLHWALFDGVDDGLATASIDFTATDKMGVFAGLTRSSDALASIVAELSANVNTNNGSFYMLAPATNGLANFGFATKGTTLASRNEFSGAAPYSAILTMTGDIAAPSLTNRINGIAGTTVSTSQGTGNFGNYALYVGARSGASSPFNGKLNQLTVLGRTPTAGEITDTESYIATKTGVVL